MPTLERSLTAEQNRRSHRDRACIITASVFALIGLIWIGVVFLVGFPTKPKHTYKLYPRQYDGETPAFNIPIVQQLDQDADGMPDQPLVWSVENSLVDPLALGYETNIAHGGEDMRQEEYAALLRSGVPSDHGKAYHGVLDLKTRARSVSDEPAHGISYAVNPPSLEKPYVDGTPVPEGETSGQRPYATWLESYLPILPGFSYEPSQEPSLPEKYAAWLASYLPTPPGFSYEPSQEPGLPGKYAAWLASYLPTPPGFSSQASNDPPTSSSSSDVLPKERRSNEPRAPRRPFAEAIRCTECDISPRRYCNDHWGQRGAKTLNERLRSQCWDYTVRCHTAFDSLRTRYDVEMDSEMGADEGRWVYDCADALFLRIQKDE